MFKEKIKLFFLFVLICGLTAGCSVEEPVLPSWAVPVTVPLSKDTLLFRDEIADGSTIVDIGDTLFINIDREFESENVSDDDLTLSGRDTSISVMLEEISLDSIGTQSADLIEMADILPEFSSYVGETVTVPETTVTSDPIMAGSDDFSSAVINHCNIRICVYNDMPFTIGPNSYSPDGMGIQVSDSTGTFVSALNLEDDIEPGGVACVEELITPGDSWIRAPLWLEYSIPVSGDTTFYMTQDILDSSSCRLEVTLLDLDVKEIIGKVPSQIVTREYSLAIGEGDRIIEGNISSGAMSFDFINQVPLGSNLDMRLPDLKKPDDSSYSKSLVLDPDGTDSFAENLSGHRILNSESPGSPLDSMQIEVEIVTGESSSFVHLRDTDSVSVSVHTDLFKFASLEGYLSEDSFEIGPFEENDVADYQDISGSFNFQQALLRVRFQNDLNIENLDLSLRITGYHNEFDEGITDSANVVINMPVEIGDNIFLISDHSVVDLLNIYPTDIVYSGELIYSGYSSVSVGDQVSGDYSFSTPLEIEIEDPDPVEFDSDTLSMDDIGETFRDGAGDEFQSAVLRACIENRSFLGGTVRFFVSRDISATEEEFYDTTNYSVDSLGFTKPIVFDAAPANPVNGFVETPVVSDVVFSLNSNELSVFKDPPVRTGFQLILQNTEGRVIVRGSDFIRLSGEVEFEFFIHDDEE